MNIPYKLSQTDLKLRKNKNKNIQCNYITRRKASMNIPSKLSIRRSKGPINFIKYL
jgi:hypothetical protein